jgi:uncharacterized coiled-coil DUF342 family protein
VEEERDYFGEQLKEMENEVLNERNQREELTARLQQLQQKVHPLLTSPHSLLTPPSSLPPHFPLLTSLCVP